MCKFVSFEQGRGFVNYEDMVRYFGKCLSSIYPNQFGYVCFFVYPKYLFKSYHRKLIINAFSYSVSHDLLTLRFILIQISTVINSIDIDVDINITRFSSLSLSSLLHYPQVPFECSVFVAFSLFII